MAKHAFECPTDQRGVKITHYHADNGHFADNAFITDCKAQRQGLSYCGVNTHFQNGIAERRIRDLQEQTRTSMLYAMNKWKHMVLICLWPYAMRHANNVANATPRKGEDQPPLERFWESTSLPNYVISMPLAALPTYWTTLSKVAKDHRSGNNAQDWVYTSGLRRVTQGLSLWSSIHTLDMSHPNFMSNSTIFLRRCRINPAIWTRQNRFGSTSVALRLRRVAPNPQAEG